MYLLDDFAASSQKMSSWVYLGLKRLQLDNRRMFLGSLWLFLSFAFMVTAIAMLISELQGLEFMEHIRYVGFGFAAFNFISSAIVMGSQVFITNRSFLLQLRLPKTAFAHALIVRLLVLFAVQIITASIIAVIAGWQPTLIALAALPALLLYVVTAYGVILLLGCLTTRIRDLAELISAVVRVSFFFTPVIWLPERRGARIMQAAAESPDFSFMAALYTWNPLAHYLDLIRAPLLGELPSATSVIVAGSCSFVLVALGLVALQLTGRRLTYWL